MNIIDTSCNTLQIRTSSDTNNLAKTLKVRKHIMVVFLCILPYHRILLRYRYRRIELHNINNDTGTISSACNIVIRMLTNWMILCSSKIFKAIIAYAEVITMHCFIVTQPYRTHTHTEHLLNNSPSSSFDKCLTDLNKGRC